jgi:hypothetical protein
VCLINELSKTFTGVIGSGHVPVASRVAPSAPAPVAVLLFAVVLRKSASAPDRRVVAGGSVASEGTETAGRFTTALGVLQERPITGAGIPSAGGRAGKRAVTEECVAGIATFFTDGTRLRRKRKAGERERDEKQAEPPRRPPD